MTPNCEQTQARGNLVQNVTWTNPLERQNASPGNRVSESRSVRRSDGDVSQANHQVSGCLRQPSLQEYLSWWGSLRSRCPARRRVVCGRNGPIGIGGADARRRQGSAGLSVPFESSHCQIRVPTLLRWWAMCCSHSSSLGSHGGRPSCTVRDSKFIRIQYLA